MITIDAIVTIPTAHFQDEKLLATVTNFHYYYY